jgi:hypothetical protein
MTSSSASASAAKTLRKLRHFKKLTKRPSEKLGVSFVSTVEQPYAQG